jgi:hypothetical protein
MLPHPLDARTLPLESYVEVLRAELRSGKVRILTAILDLDEQQAEVFWPIYHRYEVELFALGDRHVDLVKKFVDAHDGDRLDGKAAGEIAAAWFALQQERLSLLEKYHGILSKKLAGRSAAGFVQIENRMGTLVDLMIASGLPLIRTPAVSEATSSPGESPAPAGLEVSGPDPLGSYILALRDELRSGKVNLITDVMNLSASEATVFWPLYHAYEVELFALGDRRLDLVGRFLTAYGDGLRDHRKAAEITAVWFELEAERLVLLKKYHGLFDRELSAIRAAQFVQIEHRVGTLVDLAVASEMPLVRGAVADDIRR